MSDNITNRADLRKQLLSNGYKPLPLLDKGVRIPEWSRVDITPEWLHKYDRQPLFANTGIRCDDVLAFDIDVTDEEYADEIEALIEEHAGHTELCRVGAWPKRLLLYRLAGEAPKSARTGKYGDAGHMVELLAGPGRQFAAYGIHPGTGQPYEWEGGDPLTVPLKALPVLDYDHAIRILEEIEAAFVDWGFEKTCSGFAHGVGGNSVYDIEDDTEIQLVDGDIVPWSELRDTLDKDGVWGNVRRENGEFGDSDGIHLFLSVGRSEPCYHDFPRDETHFEKDVSAGLADSLPPLPDDGVNLFTDPNLAYMLDTFCLLADKTVRFIAQPERVYSFDGFNLRHAHLTSATPTKQNQKKRSPTVSVWKTHKDTHRADHAEMRPDHAGESLFQEGAQIVFNTYRPPVFESEGGSLDVLMEFVTHLIPDPVERELFLDWHALKVANPHWRMHGLVMVTPTFGTGRGTWAKIVEALFGSMYVKEVPLHNLTGTSGQSDYNDYLASSLVINVPEAFEQREDMSRWQSRSAAYEQLKQVCDSAEGSMLVKRKYGRNSFERVYASLLISTNHADALAIAPGDRRLIVLTNTRVPLAEAPGALIDRINDWRSNPANIGALHAWLMKRAAGGVAYDPFGLPIDTPAKTAMISAARSDLEKLYDIFTEQAEGDVCTPAQWRQFAFVTARGGEFQLPDGPRGEKALALVIAKNARRINTVPETSGMKVGGHAVRPWVIRNFDQWVDEESRETIKSELLKNGDPAGRIAAI